MLTRNKPATAKAEDSECANPQEHPDSAGDPIQFILSFPRAQRHYLHVSATVPTDGKDRIEVMMPVWTPGSYLVREYSKNVEGFTASTQDGKPLSVRKARKNRWEITTEGSDNVLLEYDVYGHELSVRTNWVDRDYAFVVPAATFVTRPDTLQRRHDVRVSPPRSWRKVLSGLPKHKDSRLHFRAADFETLVDSPFLIGTPVLHEFEVAKKKHVLANLHGNGIWDEERSARDTQRLVEEEIAMWGDAPYSEYTFMNMLVEHGGGLEHKNSTALMSSRWNSRDRGDYLRWLGLVAHEFFHTWNVKRLRPIDLGPFDYESENYSESMWVAEGITSYYDDLIVKRAGLSTEAEYLESFSKSIESMMAGPGWKAQSLTLSSFDAWIKLYRPDENSLNSGVNYYRKGAVVAFLLDAEIRRVTDSKTSLDDVMRRAYALYSGECGYTDQQFRDVVSEVAGVDMGGWLARHLDTTEALDFSPAFDHWGLRFKPRKATEASGPQKDDPWFKHSAPRIGFTTKSDRGRVIVKSVVDGEPAAVAGIDPGDEILALAGYRVRPENFSERLGRLRSGESVTVLVSRQDSIESFEVLLEPPEDFEWQIEVDPDASEDQVARRSRWLASLRRSA